VAVLFPGICRGDITRSFPPVSMNVARWPCWLLPALPGRPGAPPPVTSVAAAPEEGRPKNGSPTRHSRLIAAPQLAMRAERTADLARLRPTAGSGSPRWRIARRRVGACRSRPVSFPPFSLAMPSLSVVS